MNETISAQEAAELYGITRQAVYKRMLSTWKPYVVNQLSTNGNRQKRLRMDILKDFPVNQTVNQVDKSLHEVDSKVDTFDNQSVNHDNPVDNAKKPEMASGDDLTAFLMKQIETKDKLIESLTTQNQRLLEALQAAQMLQAKQMQVQIPEKTEPVSAESKGFISRLKSWWNSTAPQQ